MLLRSLSFLSVLSIAAALPAAAGASKLIDRNATDLKLAVNKQGQALLNYRARGRVTHVLAWGAINALAPTTSRPQVKFKVDYAGGWGTYRRDVSKTFKDACRTYDGPKLPWLVTACKAPDGSYWAVQSWQHVLPNLGFRPWLPWQTDWWLLLSHWSGPLAKLEVWHDWVYGGRYHELFGRLTYAGRPVYGFHTTPSGARLDRYGALLALDTYNSPLGRGWKRENSFVSHNPTGVFCYHFVARKPSPGYPARKPLRGNGEKYRITVTGPGVTPDIMWQGTGLHDFDKSNPDDVAYEARMNDILDLVMAGDKRCRHH